jgi:polyisoprenoid-binding protein YceI
MPIVAEAHTAPTTQRWSAWHIDPRHSLAQFSVRHMMLSKVLEIELEAVREDPAPAADAREATWK